MRNIDKDPNERRFADMEGNPAYMIVRDARRAGRFDNRIRNLLASAIKKYTIMDEHDLKNMTDSDLCHLNSCGPEARMVIKDWLKTIDAPRASGGWVQLERDLVEFCRNALAIKGGEAKWPPGVCEDLKDRIIDNAYTQLSEALQRAREGKAAVPTDIESIKPMLKWAQDNAKNWNDFKKMKVTSLEARDLEK